jgi:hypothetical protein
MGGVYGSRHTSLYYPGGFEILAPQIPLAAAVARFMRERLGQHNVVTPANSDVENLPSLSYSYLEACLTSDIESQVPLPSLPCQELDSIRHFPDSGISVVGTRRYYAVINASKGGVCRIFDKSSHRLAYQDAGYLVNAGGRQWTSQLIGLGRRLETGQADQVACVTRLAKVQQELPTPGKFLLLRLLNLTLFRSPALGSWLRGLIVTRLILTKRPAPIHLHRSVTFGASEIHFRDRLEMERPTHVEDVALPRSFTAIHMGSARYFHSSELEPTPHIPVDRMARDLNRDGTARREFSLRFSNSGESGLLPELAIIETETVRLEA